MRTIEQRLLQLEEERELLIRLRRIHSGGASAQASTLPAPATVSASEPETASGNGAVVASRPSDAATIKLKPTPAILHVVRSEPGIEASKLIDRAERIADSESANVRSMLSWTAGELVRKGQLRKEDGRFFLAG